MGSGGPWRRVRVQLLLAKRFHRPAPFQIRVVRVFAPVPVTQILHISALVFPHHGDAALRPLLGLMLERLCFVVRGDVPRGPYRLSRAYRLAVLNTFDWYGAHEYQ